MNQPMDHDVGPELREASPSEMRRAPAGPAAPPREFLSENASSHLKKERKDFREAQKLVRKRNCGCRHFLFNSWCNSAIRLAPYFTRFTHSRTGS